MKVISQETFDLVVLENIKDFENTVDEAIEEAVKEFEAQGVQLGNIVKNPTFDEGKQSISHVILDSLKKLKNELETLPVDEVFEHLTVVQDQCNLSLAHRMLATKHEGYSILMLVADKLKDENVEGLSMTFGALTSLTTTNPDVLDREGINLMSEMLLRCGSGSGDETLAENVAKWCLQCCLKHERNRQDLVEADVPRSLVDIIKLKRNDGKCVKAACKALRAFTLDDDIRIEYGKAHDHARLLVEEHRLITLSMDVIKDFVSDSSVTSELLSTVSRLCVRAEYCQEAVDKGALAVINDILVSFPDNASLIRQCLNLLKTVSGNDKVKAEVIKIGAAPLIISALVTHQNNSGVCEAGCSAISMLALRVPAHAIELVQLGAADAVAQAMKIHCDNLQIQKLGCMSARNLVSRVPENRLVFIQNDIENIIQTALSTFPKESDLQDVAKAALRDMDLQVYLEEQWKGTGIEISR